MDRGKSEEPQNVIDLLQIKVKLSDCLNKAIKCGEINTIRVLIEAGADPSFSGTDGLAPIHMAAITGSVEIGSILIQNGADCNARCAKSNMTAFKYAIARNHKFIEMILTKNLKLDLIDELDLKTLQKRGLIKMSENKSQSRSF
jgi:ankyrin repeat protein